MRLVKVILAAFAAMAAWGAAHAAYPGENGVIVFEAEQSGMIGRVAPSAGAPITYLHKGMSPAVSPSGKRIAFQSDFNVYVMNIDGSNVVQVTNDGESFGPTWLPDGSHIVYVKYLPKTTGESFCEVWSARFDGAAQAILGRLPYDNVECLSIRWAPGGPTALIPLYFNGSGSPGLWFISPGISPVPTSRFRNVPANYPSWSPDGKSALILNVSSGLVEEDYLDGSPRFAPVNAGYVVGYHAISPDGSYVAAGVGPFLAPHNLETRPRAGGSPVLTWTAGAVSVDWSRVPKNCYESTPEGGGGVLAGETELYVEKCAVAVMPDRGQKSGGVLAQVVAVGPDSRVYHRSLVTDPFGGLPVWTPFEVVPGTGGTVTGIRAKKVAIAGSKDGSSQVLIVGADDDVVYHTLRNADGSWQSSGFAPLDGPGGCCFQARDVAISISGSTSNSPGNAQVIANGLAVGGVYHRIHNGNVNWSPFQPVPGAGGMDTRELAIAAGEDGNAYVLATVAGPNGTAQIKRQVRYPNSWDPSFVTVAVPVGVTLTPSSAIALTLSATGNAQLLYTDQSGAARFQERTTPLSQSSWTAQVPNFLVASSGSRAVSLSAWPMSAAPTEVLLVRASTQ
jgi:hypothetical protein